MEKQKIDYYVQHDRMYVATDQIVFGFDNGELKLLIYKRKFEPNKGQWSLIGSFVKLNENISLAAQRVLSEITGLTDIYFEQSQTYGDIDRDNNGYRCISVAQYALIRIEEHDRELVEKHGAYWFNLKEVPDLILDHNIMVRDALEKLRGKARLKPIGFELLPEKFTIPQLQKLYEEIYQRELEPANFRKKVMALGVLRKLNEKDMSSSKRGAFLYEFDNTRYKELLESGFNFEL